MTEAKKLVPDSIQVDGAPEMPRIRLKMGAKDPEPTAQRLTLKMPGQTSETPKDVPSSGVAVDNDSLKRQQDLVRTGSASQSQDADAPRSPRTRSLRRQIGSPRSSVATTPSASEQPRGVAVNGRDATHVKDETPSQHPERRSSHALQGAPLESTGGVAPYDGTALSLDPTVCFDLADFNLIVTAPHPPPEPLSPLDSIWRRPDQGECPPGSKQFEKFGKWIGCMYSLTTISI